MSRDILLSNITPDTNQPRKHFDNDSIDELAQSIRENGLLAPIMIRPTGDTYTIVHGERRYRAVSSLDWKSIPAIIKDVAPDDVPFMALVENLQRNDLSPLEEARAYQALVDSGHKQTGIAKRIGKSQSYIAQKLRLLKLPEEVQLQISAGRISEGHGRQLLRLRSGGAQSDAGQAAEKDGMSVSALKSEIDRRLLIEGAEATIADGPEPTGAVGDALDELVDILLENDAHPSEVREVLMGCGWEQGSTGIELAAHVYEAEYHRQRIDLLAARLQSVDELPTRHAQLRKLVEISNSAHNLRNDIAENQLRIERKLGRYLKNL